MARILADITMRLAIWFGRDRHKCRTLRRIPHSCRRVAPDRLAARSAEAPRRVWVECESDKSVRI